MIIYHNPRCSKSRQALALLEKHGISPQIIDYLKTPIKKATLSKLCQQLGIKPSQLVRIKEEVVKNKQLKTLCKTEDDWLNAMIADPILIERPIISDGEKAVLGRPPENILLLLK